MRPIRSVSVLVPTYQGMQFLERMLAALAAQELALPWDLSVIDSSSTDGTWELLKERASDFPVPVRLERIHGVEFDHGDTRNLLAARSKGDLLVFLTQDAIPTSPRWLAMLAADFDDPTVAAAYCRNVPRPDAHLLTAMFSAADFGYSAERRVTRLPDAATYAALPPYERRVLYNFNDVASAVRRELWERHPFPRTAFGEDVLMARALLEAGLAVVYDADASVEHSHDYDERETYARAWTDGRFNQEWLGRTCVASERDARALARRFELQDKAAIEALGVDAERAPALLERASKLRRAAFLGLHAGGRDAPRRHPPTRLLDEPALHVLYVVHGFPPDTWAGTEVYTYNLALEMQRRGHRCTVLARIPARDGGPPDFDVEETEFQGLRVLRMTHGLVHDSMRHSFAEPRAEAVFRRVLQSERPDVVHFQHLIHTSVGLVDVAREFGLPTVLTCHDYWGLCARVQLIRPDGRRCEQNQGSGCFLCVKERFVAGVELVHRLDSTCGGVMEGLARDAEDGPWGWLRERVEDYRAVRERERVVPAAYAACDLRISPSRFLRDKYLASGDFDPHTFLFSDNGMRTDHVRALEKRPDPEGRVRFGFVGSLVWYKGGEVLIAAMQRLAGTRAVLNVHGGFDPESDPHHAALEALARAGNVHFKGRFDNARLSEVYAEIDVLVVPSLWFENSPITIHEAFLTRTPVLASDIGGMAEFVRDGVDGLHFAAGDDADLAAKMRRFLDEPDLVERLSRDFPPVKTIAENAEEMEFRYRGLACRVRPAPRPIVFERAGSEAARREGPVEAQGRDLLLLRPGGSAVEYDLDGVRPGPVELVVEVLALGSEITELGGRLLVDGAEVGRVPPFRGGPEDELRAFRYELVLAPGARQLRLEAALAAGGPEAHLRVKRVWLRERAPEAVA